MKKFKSKSIKYYLSLFVAIVSIFFTGCSDTDSDINAMTHNDYEKSPPTEREISEMLASIPFLG